MRVFKTKSFSRRAKDMGLDDEALLKAIREMLQGLYEANLGGSIYKKRVPLGARGKSGGARTIVAFKMKDKAIFLYGFPKNERGNINKKEEGALKGLADVFLNYSENQIADAVKAGDLIEVHDEKIH
ncbi:MAG: type II toxin-antitoxin system RelE/ParE family toxin [Gammaproteobacteria bacterium]|nr:type II toxin-antitoxin system RelE/ParE family toxin [Gammaproteobacteria bacterium]